ncbi:hypothetical protein ACNKHL_13685 [Shigella flexneri]
MEYPSGTIPAKIGLHAEAQDRALKDGSRTFYGPCVPTTPGRAEHQRRAYAGLARSRTSSSSPIRIRQSVRWPPT